MGRNQGRDCEGEAIDEMLGSCMLTVKCLLIHPHSNFLEWFQGGVIQILPTCCGNWYCQGQRPSFPKGPGPCSCMVYR